LRCFCYFVFLILCLVGEKLEENKREIKVLGFMFYIVLAVRE
jgi:hypothetical protein